MTFLSSMHLPFQFGSDFEMVGLLQACLHLAKLGLSSLLLRALDLLDGRVALMVAEQQLFLHEQRLD